MRELQLISWDSGQYLVENEQIARHSNGEVMVDCNSMASSLDLVEERHGGRIDLQRHDPDFPTYRLLESSPRQPYGFAANISVPTASIGWQVAEISPSFNTPPLAILNHDIWP